MAKTILNNLNIHFSRDAIFKFWSCDSTPSPTQAFVSIIKTILNHDGECRESLKILALLAIFTEKRLSYTNFKTTLAGHFREEQSWLVGQKRRMVLEVKGGEKRINLFTDNKQQAWPFAGGYSFLTLHLKWAEKEIWAAQNDL